MITVTSINGVDKYQEILTKSPTHFGIDALSFFLPSHGPMPCTQSDILTVVPKVVTNYVQSHDLRNWDAYPVLTPLSLKKFKE
jgi:hypothetical protein